MKRVIVWGNRCEYDFFCKYFEAESLKLNMEISAVVLNEESLFREVDGIEVIKIDELLVRQYDYLINMNQEGTQMVRRILELLKIPLEKVIPAEVFVLPTFDLDRYIKVRESRVSIISNHCWGGMTYHSLGMQFLSPFINMFIEGGDYLKLLHDFDYYMNAPVHYIKDGYEPNLRRNYPIVGLEDVVLHWNHDTNFDSAVAIWDKRKARINKDNLVVEMMITQYRDIEGFVALPFQYKIGFSAVPCREENVFYLPIPEKEYLQGKYEGNFSIFINNLAAIRSEEYKYYDVLKLLSREKDFMRFVSRTDI